jgi:archaellum component FlaC/energy-coupling factor transporter ATP-binding protein EcfA2
MVAFRLDRKAPETRKFWFYSAKVETAIANLGNRYTPEINFELEISKIFDGIAQDEKFKKQFHNKLDALLISLSKIRPNYKECDLATLNNSLNNCCQFLNSQYELLASYENIQFDFTPISSNLEEIYDLLSKIKKRIDELKALKSDDKNKDDDNSSYYLRQAYFPLGEFNDFIESITVKLYNNPYLLLDGEAGIGKSHLLADIANIRIKEGKCSLLFLGQHFNSNYNPSIQILKQLELRCNFEDFLEALNCKAQLSGERIIIFIDAINEGSGKAFWPDYFNGFIGIFTRYKWLGLVLSIRSSYVILLESNIKNLKDTLIRFTHYGFRNVEYDASKLYFNSYNIESPSIPLLHPEFQNPLFLRLFCEGLKKAGLSKIPDGLQGITKIFDFFIKSINKRLSKPNYFDYSPSLNIVDKVVKKLVKFKIDNNLYYIPSEKAIELIGGVKDKYSINGNLFDALISEGILSKNLFWKDKKEYEEGIYIAYERLEEKWFSF